MQLILIHNEKAGSGRYSLSTIRKFLEEAGHRVCAYSPQRDKLKKALKQPADLIVIAGGDGAVSKVIDHAKAKGPPLTILPLGTANNIATSLGITGEPAALIETWNPPKTRPFYRLYAKGPWGRRRITEGIGFGCFEQAMDEMGTQKPDIENAREWLAEAILRTPPERLAVQFDSAALTEEFSLLEVTNIPLVGPRIHLAPFANPSDPLMMVSFVGPRLTERLEFSRWLKRAAFKAVPPVTTRAARRVVIEGEIRRVRLNDKNWTAKTERSENSVASVVIKAEVKPLHFLIPRLEALSAPRTEGMVKA
ncbi:MAG: diacylglycerol/lipid kinase family protein [Stellaceae bacterium]